MEELEDNIIKHFQDDSENIHTKVCVEESKICRSGKRVSEEL